MNRPEIQEFDFVKTTAPDGSETGWVIGVAGDENGLLAYQTLLMPTLDKKTPVMKGYHSYRKQTNRLTCTAGFVTIRVYWDEKRRVDYELAEHHPVCLTIPPGNPFAILNYEPEFARVANHPVPQWQLATFQADQYDWEPTLELRDQNGEIVDLTAFIPKERA